MTARERAGLIIRHAIDKSGLTATEVARRAGIDAGSMSSMAKGKRSPSFVMILRIIEACGLEFIEIRVRKVGTDNK